MSALSSSELRQLVREALREVLPAVGPASGAGGSLVSRLRAALSGQGPARIDVAMTNDADLGNFARNVAQAAEHEDLKAAIVSGQIGFALARNRTQTDTPMTKVQHRIDKGVVTEIMVSEIGKANGRLVIGKGVVVTPLARDRAREVKLEIVRDRS